MNKILICLLLFLTGCFKASSNVLPEALVIGIDHSISQDLRPKIYEAAGKINKATGKRLLYIKEDCVAIHSCIFLVKDWEGRSATEQAFTRKFRHDPNSLIYINGDDFDWTKDYYDFESLMLHELGHAIGLLHNNDKDSFMYPYLDKNQKRNILTNDDVEFILKGIER